MLKEGLRMPASRRPPLCSYYLPSQHHVMVSWYTKLARDAGLDPLLLGQLISTKGPGGGGERRAYDGKAWVNSDRHCRVDEMVML